MNAGLDMQVDRSTPVRVPPDFCVIGHSKSGTTALHDTLAQHPGVFMSHPKEPNFFATDLTRDEIQGAAFSRMTPEAYRGLFANAKREQLCGESSASNIYSTTAAAEMAAWNPEMRLIAVFREPVDYLVSYHQQMLKNPIVDGEVEKSLLKALELEPARRRGESIPKGQQVPELLYYSRRVRYAEQLKRVYEHFAPDQVLVLIYDDFRADNLAVLHKVCEFLGLDASFDFAELRRNKGAMVRSKTAQNVLMDLAHGRGLFGPVKRAVKSVVPPRVSRRALRWALYRFAFAPKVDLDHKSKEDLRRRFADEVASFSEMIGRDLLTEWGYQKA